MNREGGHGDHRGRRASGGHAGHADMVSDFRRRFWICLAPTVPVLLMSPVIFFLMKERARRRGTLRTSGIQHGRP